MRKLLILSLFAVAVVTAQTVVIPYKTDPIGSCPAYKFAFSSASGNMFYCNSLTKMWSSYIGFACSTTPPTTGAAHSTCYDTSGVLQQCNNGASACTTSGQWVAQAGGGGSAALQCPGTSGSTPTAEACTQATITACSAGLRIAFTPHANGLPSGTSPTLAAGSCTLPILSNEGVALPLGTLTVASQTELYVNAANTAWVAPPLVPSATGSVATGSLAIGNTLLGTTPTNALTLQNTTPAANGAQQYSPATEWIGQGWATGTGLSTPVGFRAYTVPVQGTTTGASYWGLFYHPPSGGDVLGLSMLPNGNVGIGTTGPATPLSVLSTASDSSSTITVTNMGAGASSQASVNTVSNAGNLVFGIGSTAAAFGGGGFVYTGSAIPFSIWTNNLERMRITSTGNVGIGMTGPVSKLHIGVAPIATANYATLSIGSGAWDGTTTGKFVGSASGSSIGVNEVSGYGGNLINLQVAGISQFNVTSAGVMTLAGSTFVLGGHTCSIVSTVLTCP